MAVGSGVFGTQLEVGGQTERAIVSFNHKDFAVLHSQYMAEGKEHWGIILSTEESMNAMRHRLLRLLKSLTAEELKNQMRWLN